MSRGGNSRKQNAGRKCCDKASINGRQNDGCHGES